MPTYEVAVGDAKYRVDAPDEVTAWNWANYTHTQAPTPAPVPAPAPPPFVPQAALPTPSTGFIPSVKRGFYETSSLLGDVLPAMVARGLGYDEYANRQWQEAAETKKKVEQEFPSEVPSYTDIKDAGTAYKYVVESIGENLASIIPTILTGGVAGLLATGAKKAAITAASKVAAEDIAKAAAVGPLQAATIAQIEKKALEAGVKQAQRIGLKADVAGALTGSALQNIPEVYQNIKETTGKEDIGAALIFGGINAGLDAILPVQLMQKARAAGIPTTELGAAWYKRLGKGLATGFAGEGATEFAQEASSAAAEKFVDNNQEFFSKQNLERFINAGLKGGIGGGAITGTTNVVFGKGPDQAQFPGVNVPPAPPPPAPPVAPPAPVNPPAPPPARLIDPNALLEQLAQLTGVPPNVGQTNAPAGGTSPGVAGVAGTGAPAPGAGTIDTSGVVSTQPNVGQPAGGEGQPAATVTAPAPPAPTPAPPAPPPPATPALTNPLTDDFLNQLGINDKSAVRQKVGKVEMGSAELLKSLRPLATNPKLSEQVRQNVRNYLDSLKPPAPAAPATPAATFTADELSSADDLLNQILGGTKPANLPARAEGQSQMDQLKELGTRLGINLNENEELAAFALRVRDALNAHREQQAKAQAQPQPQPQNLLKDRTAKEIAESERKAGENYDANRNLLPFGDDDETLNFLEEAEKGHFPKGFEWGGVRLNNLLDRNRIEEPWGLPSDEYDTKDAAGKEAEKAEALTKIVNALNSKRNVVLDWKNLTRDQRDVYLAHLVSDTPAGRKNALEALNKYTKDVREAQGHPAELKASPAAGIYERNRPAYNRRHARYGVSYPSWGSLSDIGRKLYIYTLKNKVLTNKETLEKFPDLETKSLRTILGKAKAEDIDFASGMLANHLELVKARQETENRAATQRANEERAKAEAERKASQQKQTEERTKWQEAPEGQRAEPVDVESSPVERILRRLAEKFKPTDIPKHVIAQIKSGNMKAVMQYLRTASPNKLHRKIAQRLYEIGVNSKIELVDSLPDGRVAEYDATTDTVRVTTEGLKDKYLLHEIVHATTVKVIDAYLGKRFKELTPQQLDAARHLEELMNDVRKVKVQRLAGERRAAAIDKVGITNKQDFVPMEEAYPNAFEDLYEFVSYAITDEDFQNDLTQISWAYGKVLREVGGKMLPVETITKSTLPKKDEIYTFLPEKRSLWTEFVGTIAKLLGMERKLFDKETVRGSNALIETFAAFESILMPSQGGFKTLETGRPSLAAKRRAAAPAPAPAAAPAPAPAAQTTKAAPSRTDKSAEEIQAALPIAGRTVQPTVMSIIKKRGFWDNMVRKFQNAQRVLKQKQEMLERYGKVIHLGDDINNVWSQAVLSSGRAWWNYTNYLSAPTNEVHRAIEDFAKSENLSIDDALKALHGYGIAVHEPERRKALYLLKVPLEGTKQTVKIGNKQYTAEGARDEILKSIVHPSTTEADAKNYRKMLEAIVKDPANRKSFMLAKDKKTSVPVPAAQFDIDNETYNVAGPYSKKELEDIREFYLGPNAKYDKAKMEAVYDALKKVQEETQKLNQQANYWSQGVANLVAFYGYKHYIPFKGRAINTESDRIVDPLEAHSVGADLNEKEHAFGGRNSDFENPVLQTLADGARSAMRLGRKDLTLSIKNAVKQGLLKGDINTVIKFEDRARNPDALKPAEGQKTVLHYEPDGSITVIKLQNNLEAEAIRRTYREANPLLEKANSITSFVGQLHTRYSLPFAPMNFVRDTLTNAYTLGAELGPKKSFQLIEEISRQVATNGGLNKAAKVAYYMSNDRVGEAKALASKDPFVADMLEYLETGGRVSYVQGIAAKGQLQELLKSVGRNNVLKTKDSVDKVFDYWTDMFELASRTASYRVLKDTFLQEARGKNMPDAEAKEYAAKRATEYTKNLANFEQVGEWGKGLGAAFMFFRPAATGAIRALDTLAPAFRSMEAAVNKVEAEGQAVGATPQQIAKAREDALKQTSNARLVSAGLLGLGSVVYLMALMLSDDDEQKRNKVATDDPARWTRYARFFIPGMENAIQIPWGFGLGAFAAAGAQISASVMGAAGPKDALSNIVQIGLDSFLPLPFSRISPLDDFASFAMDSVTPSVVRPFLEYVMNKDGLGREIYNNRQSRAGDAYTGGDNIPEIYKKAARFLFDSTNGGIDWSPNTLYFFAGNYADGIMRGISGLTNIGMSAVGHKSFNPKTDTLIFDSFFGSPSNYDAREFSSIENQIKDIERRLNTLKQDPQRYSEFVSKNPTYPFVVDYYNSQINGMLKDTRKYMNDIRSDRYMSPKQKEAMIDNIKPVQNMIKRNLIETFKQVSDLRP